MREPKKVERLSQKLYYLVCGIGFLVLIVLMLIYANQMKNRNQIANKEVHLDEVGNRAIQKQAEEKKVEKENTASRKGEPNKEIADNKVKAKSTEQKQEKARETLSYDGQDKLAWPVRGNIILPYSMDTTVYFQTLDQYKCNPGMLIEAKLGQGIAAPGRCKVLEVSKSEELGKELLLDFGNEYTLRLGQLKDVKVKVGDSLKEGDVLAFIAEPTKYYTLEGNHLYMEMLHKDKPVNPLKYLKE